MTIDSITERSSAFIPIPEIWVASHRWRNVSELGDNSANTLRAVSVNIRQAIQTYYGDSTGEHHRYRSWEHCYQYFRKARADGLALERDHAALHLAFYLASWGMYRGSSFLLQHAYTVHRGAIDVIADPLFDVLWDSDLGTTDADVRFLPRLHELIASVRKTYRPFAATSAQPTDTLITKLILGTFGCLPACDRYFIDGFKSKGLKYAYLNDQFIERILGFCQEHRTELKNEQASIERTSRVRYPLMKLVDMYFWQTGYEMDTNARVTGSR